MSVVRKTGLTCGGERREKRDTVGHAECFRGRPHVSGPPFCICLVALAPCAAEPARLGKGKERLAATGECLELRGGVVEPERQPNWNPRAASSTSQPAAVAAPTSSTDPGAGSPRCAPRAHVRVMMPATWSCSPRHPGTASTTAPTMQPSCPRSTSWVPAGRAAFALSISARSRATVPGLLRPLAL